MKQQVSLHRAQATHRNARAKPESATMNAQVTLNPPTELKHTVQEAARKYGVDLNWFITMTLIEKTETLHEAEKAGKMDAAAFFAKRGKGGSAARAIRFLKNRPE